MVVNLKNAQFDDLCFKRGYRHEYSAPRTPQQNGVVEKKNRTLQELARTNYGQELARTISSPLDDSHTQ
jgi:hypothetical protein